MIFEIFVTLVVLWTCIRALSLYKEDIKASTWWLLLCAINMMTLNYAFEMNAVKDLQAICTPKAGVQ